MPLTNAVNTLCTPMTVTSGDVCVTMPVGVELCVNYPSIIPPTQMEQLQQMFAQLNSAITPLSPIFNIIEAILAVFECMKAVVTLNPKEIAACIPALGEKVSNLLKLVPQLSLPIMIIEILDAIILFIGGLIAQLQLIQAYQQQILDAETAVAGVGNAGLASVILCARTDLAAFVQSMNEAAKPINRLIGIINAFIQILGIDKCIPTLADIDPDALAQAIEVLSGVLVVLAALRGAIPLPGPSTSVSSGVC